MLFLEASAKTKEGISQVFQEVVQKVRILQHMLVCLFAIVRMCAGNFIIRESTYIFLHAVLSFLHSTLGARESYIVVKHAPFEVWVPQPRLLCQHIFQRRLLLKRRY